MAHEACYNTITTKQFIATKQKTFGDKNFLIEQCFHVIVFVSTVQAPNRQEESLSENFTLCSSNYFKLNPFENNRLTSDEMLSNDYRGVAFALR